MECRIATDFPKSELLSPSLSGSPSVAKREPSEWEASERNARTVGNQISLIDSSSIGENAA